MYADLGHFNAAAVTVCGCGRGGTGTSAVAVAPVRHLHAWPSLGTMTPTPAPLPSSTPPRRPRPPAPPLSRSPTDLPQVSFCCFVYPCLVVTYMGQASFVMARPDDFGDPFWNSVPKPAFWPMIVVATLTSVVASQARAQRPRSASCAFPWPEAPHFVLPLAPSASPPKNPALS